MAFLEAMVMLLISTAGILGAIIGFWPSIGILLVFLGGYLAAKIENQIIQCTICEFAFPQHQLQHHMIIEHIGI